MLHMDAIGSLELANNALPRAIEVFVNQTTWNLFVAKFNEQKEGGEGSYAKYKFFVLAAFLRSKPNWIRSRTIDRCQQALCELEDEGVGAKVKKTLEDDTRRGDVGGYFDSAGCDLTSHAPNSQLHLLRKNVGASTSPLQ